MDNEFGSTFLLDTFDYKYRLEMEDQEREELHAKVCRKYAIHVVITILLCYQKLDMRSEILNILVWLQEDRHLEFFHFLSAEDVQTLTQWVVDAATENVLVVEDCFDEL